MTLQRPAAPEASFRVGGDDEGLTEAVFIGAVDPLLVLSTHGSVLHANPAAMEVFGDDVVGTLFGIPGTPDETTEVALRTAHGTRTAEMRVGRARLGGQDVLIASLRDVTQRKQAAAALRDFVSNASHEFRSPLFAIVGFAETLSTEWDGLDEERRQHYAAIIHRQALRLGRLSDDILALSRLDADMADAVREDVSVDEALAVVVPGLSVPPEVTGGALRVHADPGHVQDVLTNLLVNAEKYGGGPVEVVATCTDDVVEIRIVDHGPGVPFAFRDRMFERFARHASSARREEGTGLGLAISRGLVERNGGSIAFEETPGGGATFVVSLPAA